MATLQTAIEQVVPVNLRLVGTPIESPFQRVYSEFNEQRRDQTRAEKLDYNQLNLAFYQEKQRIEQEMKDIRGDLIGPLEEEAAKVETQKKLELDNLFAKFLDVNKPLSYGLARKFVRSNKRYYDEDDAEDIALTTMHDCWNNWTTNNTFSTYYQWKLNNRYVNAYKYNKRAIRNRGKDVSVDVPNKEGKHLDYPGLEEDRADYWPEFSDNLGLLRKTLRSLGNRERYVLERRFGLNGHDVTPFQEIGNVLGITRERVRQIEKSTLKKVRDQIGEKI